MIFKKSNFFILQTVLAATVLLSQGIAQTKNDQSVRIIDQTITYETPMAFELMNIAFALTDTNIYSGNLNVYYNNIDTSKKYYKEVMAKFAAFKDHKLIGQLNKALRKSILKYIYNLQTGYNSVFINGKLEKDNHFSFMQKIWCNLNSVSRRTMQDFAQRSDFKSFYTQHLPYYQDNLERVKNYLQAPAIQKWLENEFPTRYDKYNIVTSPLMNGLHFTKRLNFKGDKTSIMWVADAERFDVSRYTKEQVAGIFTGVVFTEIDHNYVNPISDQYKKALNEVMGDNNRKNWIKAEGDGKYYTSGYSIFNEYMTHAVYLAYTNTVYNEKDQAVIEKSKISGMVNNRKYYRFEEFYKQLKTVYVSGKGDQKLAELYPKMIEWCKTQN